MEWFKTVLTTTLEVEEISLFDVDLRFIALEKPWNTLDVDIMTVKRKPWNSKRSTNWMEEYSAWINDEKFNEVVKRIWTKPETKLISTKWAASGSHDELLRCGLPMCWFVRSVWRSNREWKNEIQNNYRLCRSSVVTIDWESG